MSKRDIKKMIKREMPKDKAIKVVGYSDIRNLDKAKKYHSYISVGDKNIYYTTDKLKGKTLGYIDIGRDIGLENDNVSNNTRFLIEIKGVSRLAKIIPTPLVFVFCGFGSVPANIAIAATSIVLLTESASYIATGKFIILQPSSSPVVAEEVTTEDEIVENIEKTTQTKSDNVDESTFAYDGDINNALAEQETTSEIVKQQTVIDGIGNDLVVSSNTYIPLGNNPLNSGIYLEFIIFDESSDVIYHSAKLKPDESVRWFPAETLSKGVHRVTIKINVSHIDTGLADVGTDLIVNITVK